MDTKFLFAAFMIPYLFSSPCLWAQTNRTDSLHTVNNRTDSKKVENRNVMLNASDASRPREINIGLPGTVGGTEIFEDGLPVSYYFWPHISFMNWRGGTSYSSMDLMSLGESALLSGNVGYTLDSKTRIGTDKTETHINYTLDHWGTQRFDVNLSGRIYKDWYFSMGTFQNFDPGSNDLKFVKFQDRTQIYKGALSHLWNEGKGELSILFKHAGNMTARDAMGPFIYVGDGSVNLMDGFDLGRDSYIPSDGLITFQDVVSGEMKTRSLYDMNYSHDNEIGLSAKYRFNTGGLLKFNLRYKHADTNMGSNVLAGLSNVPASLGYTDLDGTPYTGNVQSRYTLYYQGQVTDLLGTLEYTQEKSNHKFRIGLNQWHNQTEMKTMTSNWAHTVEADPVHLLYNGDLFWDFNTGGEYYKGHENKLALYASDDWRALRKLSLSYGFRLEYYRIGGHAPMNPTNEEHYNDRIPGFNLANEGVRQMPFRYN